VTIDERLRARLAAIPTMSPPAVLERLYEIGAGWSGRGAAVECGCWLGATCAALASGLAVAGYDRPIYCYDRWEANASEVAKAARFGLALRPGEDLEPHFLRQLAPFGADVRSLRGPIHRARHAGGPIEIFVLDAAKREPAFGAALRAFGPSWIPGVTVVAFLDFFFYRKLAGAEREEFRCQERFAERHARQLEPLGELDSGAYFRYAGPIAWDAAAVPGPRAGRLARWLARIR
jgi:hypothetical protein